MQKCKITASYKYTSDSGGRRYSFYCDVSHAIVCSTEPIHKGAHEEELEYAWETTGKKHFNKCRKCGKWVIDAMYNPEKLECVICSPWEVEIEIGEGLTETRDEFGFGPAAMKKKKVCSWCKHICNAEERFCHICGAELPSETLFDVYGQIKKRKGKRERGKKLWDYLVKKHVFFVTRK